MQLLIMLFYPTMYHFFPSSIPTYCAHWSQTSSVYVTVKFHTHMKLQVKIWFCVFYVYYLIY